MRKISALTLIAVVCMLTACTNKKTNESSVESDEIKTFPNESLTQTDSATADGETSQTEIKTLSDVFKRLRKSPQSFSVNASKDTTLVCAEGTRIKINANSFVDEKTKQAVTGSVKFSVAEYYKKSDILLAQLSTTTNGKMLETGGMLNITASANNANVVLKQGSKISIEFPSKTRKEGMELYTGVWKNDNNINWLLDKNATDLNKTYNSTSVDEKPSFPGGMERFYQFISRNIVLSEDCDNGGRVYVGFIIDKGGNIINPKIIKGMNKVCDQDVIRVFNRIPKFSPGKMDGQPVNVYYTLPITISANDVPSVIEGNSSEEKRDNRKLNEKYDDKTIQNASTYEITSYLFQSSNLGWINCDRPWINESNSKVDFVIQTSGDTSLYIIFDKYFSVLSGYSSSNRYVFTLPNNEKITVVAVKYSEGKSSLAIEETSTGNKTLSNLAFKPVTFDVLKEELKKMDRFKR
jgi:hypothetical protein